MLAKIDGLDISFDDSGGAGPAYLCLHGWCDSRAVFDRLAPLLAERHRVIRLDWRGHGQSDAPPGDFTAEDLVADALAVIERAGADTVIPVAVAHAGWIAIELRRRLGPERVPRLVFIDWIMLDPPPPFLGALAALQNPNAWQTVRDRLFEMWGGGARSPAVERHLRETMAGYSAEMWARAGREIARAYAAHGSPLAALSALAPPCLHVYAQPADDGYLAAQRQFAAAHPWFRVTRVHGRTHFPLLEIPNDVAAAIDFPPPPAGEVDASRVSGDAAGDFPPPPAGEADGRGTSNKGAPA